MSAANQVSIDGELTIFTAADLKARLLAALDDSSAIEVDLAQVTEMDSAGLQLLIATKRQAGASGKAIRFLGHSPAVQDVLELTDLEQHLGDAAIIDKGEPA